MTRLKRSLVLAHIAAAALSSALAAGAEPPAIECEIGPLSKSFGHTGWLVYACDDDHSLVVVSEAMPFYFMFSWKDEAYQLLGEGNGDKKVTQAAFDELSKLDKAGIENLRRDAVQMSSK